MTKRLKRFALYAALALPMFTVYAAPDGPRGGREQRWEKAVEDLGLTDEQKEQVKQIMMENFESRRKIMEAHGIERGPDSRPDPEKMKEVRPELDALRVATREKLAAILSPEQIETILGDRGGRKGGPGPGGKGKPESDT